MIYQYLQIIAALAAVCVHITTVKVPLTVRLPVIVAFSSTVSVSVFTVPSKKASLYCSAVVPKSTALVVFGLSTDAVQTTS